MSMRLRHSPYLFCPYVLQQSDDATVRAKLALAEEERKKQSFYVRKVEPVLTDIRDTVSIVYNYRYPSTRHHGDVCCVLD
jgi:hypothetical protein